MANWNDDIIKNNNGLREQIIEEIKKRKKRDYLISKLQKLKRKLKKDIDYYKGLSELN